MSRPARVPVLCDASGKHCYPSRAAARIALRHLRTTLRVYRCPECFAFHLTKERGD